MIWWILKLGAYLNWIGNSEKNVSHVDEKTYLKHSFCRFGEVSCSEGLSDGTKRILVRPQVKVNVRQLKIEIDIQWQCFPPDAVLQ